MTRNVPLARLVAVALLAGAIVASVPVTADSQSAAPKVDAELLAAAKANPTGTFGVIVRGVSTAAVKRTGDRHDSQERTKKAQDSLARSSGAKRSLGLVGGASAALKGSDIIALAADPRVDRVIADRKFKISWEEETAAAAATTAGILAVNAPAAWVKADASGQGIGVAILDSGVADHPDLGTRVVARVDFTGDGLSGDPGGHGTHVAGLVAGDGTASHGAFTGVAPRANIVSVRVIDSTGTTTLSRIFAGMQWIAQNRRTYNIRVVNLSLGAVALSSYTQDLLASASELLNFAGIVVVVSAGNSGPGQSTITTPATDPFVITVGADDDSATPSLLDDSIASWSSQGPTAFDGLAKPDVVAPGRKLVSLRSAGSAIDSAYPERRVTAPGALTPQYFTMSGTSMAAPVVSGIVALMLQRNPGLTPRQVKRQLAASAHPLVGVPAAAQGAGVVDALGALMSPIAFAPYTAYPVSTAFADQLKAYLYGQPIVWRDLSFNGGVDSHGIPWSDITWDDITWDDITWEDITWEAFSWQDISWEDITWEDISWETTATPLGGSGGWTLVN